ncbi:MAG: hypothetical protein CMB92_04200 [Flammeovirgaceae bacterium]|nr:hypothetical protein [Flammeovirgaceae bacterium]|tara:strand:+ start:10823 stop:11485 length:663 start_codon:yes stop_codon:yes gene_type:complete
MMKVLFIYFLIFISFNSYTQESEFEIQKKIYSKSKIYNDPTVSITALYKMISLQPENLNLLDTLLREYIGVSRWPSAYMVSREILSNNPENLFALEVSCIALQNLGLKQESLNEYESLYLKTDRDDVLYTISFLQYELKNYNESINNLNILLEKNSIDSIKVNVNMNGNMTQQIAMKSQLHYLKGIIYEEKNDKENAKIQFNKAINLSPDFESAIKKLEK